MKIKESQLKRLVRIQVNEMAYAGRFELRYDGESLFDDDLVKIKKYTTSKTFDRLAKLHFEKNSIECLDSTFAR